jgi:hypothetical protein
MATKDSYHLDKVRLCKIPVAAGSEVSDLLHPDQRLGNVIDETEKQLDANASGYILHAFKGVAASLGFNSSVCVGDEQSVEY